MSCSCGALGAASGKRKMPTRFVRDPRIEPLIDKYVAMLGIDPRYRPRVTVVSQLAAGHMARAVWHSDTPGEGYIEIQKVAVESTPRELERIIAHEMIHHANYAEFFRSYTWKEGLPILKKIDAHGSQFVRLMELVNAQEGKDFVTKTSDLLTREEAGESKPYYVIFSSLTLPSSGARMIGVAWAVRLPKDTRILREQVLDGAALIRTTDPLFTAFSGKIRADGRIVYSFPRAEKGDIFARVAQAYEKALARNIENPRELQTMLTPPKVNPFYLVIQQLGLPGRKQVYVYAWSTDPPTTVSRAVARLVEKGQAVIATVHDPRWMDRSVRIGDSISLRSTYGKTDEDKLALEKMWQENAPPKTFQWLGKPK